LVNINSFCNAKSTKSLQLLSKKLISFDKTGFQLTILYVAVIYTLAGDANR